MDYEETNDTLQCEIHDSEGSRRLCHCGKQKRARKNSKWRRKFGWTQKTWEYQ